MQTQAPSLLLTGHERTVMDGSTIVSMTDLKGTIIDCNDQFVEISGYSRTELIGQPHNILRHPDVPKAVFKDFWMTLKAGRPWSQVVKNRCKNGDHYWVKANVTPVLKAGEIIGYKSVRSAISEAEKTAAANLYRQLDGGKKRIRYGFVMNAERRWNLFHYVHPMNVMLMMILFFGGLTMMESAGILHLPVWLDGVLVGGMMAMALVGRRYVFKRLGRAKQAMEQIRNGRYDVDLDTYGGHSLSQIMAAVKMMQIQVGAETEETIQRLNENRRLRVALDNATTNIMVVDQRDDIIYLNHALRAFLTKSEAALQSEMPGFQVASLEQSPLQALRHHAAFESHLPIDQPDQHSAEVCLAGLTLKLDVQPVINESGVRIGTVIEWLDLTQQRSIEQTLERALNLASQGHTDIKLNLKGLDGFFKVVAEDINTLLFTMNGAMEDMVKVMVNLAAGNLTQRVEKELQGSLAAMKGATNVSLDNLSTILLHIKSVAETTQNASRESAQASNDLSVRTQQAAATLEEVNATMQSINHLQTENARALVEVSELTEQAVLENQKAGEVMLLSVEAMNSIRATSDKISDIIGMIDSIAFQTNLLALNAAVEAARAGEHGRGFAVVAGEVRNLAGKSAEAANEIKRLIDESGAKVNEGSQRVQETHQVFAQVNDGVAKIGETLNAVTASIQEQQHSVTEVSSAIRVLDENIQNNAALVEETSASAESLSDQANLLMNEVAKFEIDEAGMRQTMQHYPAIWGVSMNDVRQQLRIWKTTLQSYLCGMDVKVDVQAAQDPQQSGVGLALKQLLSADPQIGAYPVMQTVNTLHEKQHNLVKLILDCRNAKTLPADFSTLELQDQMLDEFVTVSAELDGKLGELEVALHQSPEQSARLWHQVA